MNTPDTGRDDLCPCGSGKQFKHCGLGKENSTSSSHGAAGMSETLGKGLENQQFNSLQEAQAFLDKITQQQNRRRLDEFKYRADKQTMQNRIPCEFHLPGLSQA